MFKGFRSFDVVTQNNPDITIHGLKNVSLPSGKPAILLLHGFPQTHHIWHHIAPQLIDTYDVVIPDLRGYGNSSKPEAVAQYAKSRMALDCVSVMDQLGYTGAFYVCAHDRGARVAHKLIVDHPKRVHKAILLDICPTLAMYTSTDFAFASRYFHWFLLIQEYPLPETMILGNPSKLTGLFLGGTPSDEPQVFVREAFDAYVKNLSDPSCVRAMCNDYRASATHDLQEAKADLQAGKLNQVPLRIFWGTAGVIEELYDALEEWRKVSVSDCEVSGRALDSGHFIPEENPDEVLGAILDYFQ